MQGILNILKPPGMTSFDVIGYLRRLTGIKKIGHIGTLDPEAVGVLPVCIGRATKAIEFLMDKEKIYIAEARFGAITDTEDWTGKIIEEFNLTHNEEDIVRVINSFVGKYFQTPPMYSAIKIKGKRLYELARKGEEIERKPREVEIFYIKIKQVMKEKVLFEVKCSKGTYIRTLCKDIGESLSCGGHMSFLARTRVGEFKIEEAYTLEMVERASKEGYLEKLLTNVECVFKSLEEITLNNKQVDRIFNGIVLKLDRNVFLEGNIVKLYNDKDCFIGVGEVIRKGVEQYVKRKKIFVDQ